MTINPLTEWLVSNSVVALGLALLAILVSRFFRSPALTHVLWLLVIIKLITPPILRVPITMAEQVHLSPQAIATAVIDENIVSALPLKSYQQARIDSLVSTEQVLLGIWVGGSVTWLLLAGFRSWRFNRKLKLARPMNDDDQSSARNLADKLKLRKLPRLVLLEGSVPPMLWSFLGKATIAIPSRLWSSLSIKERETLLTHELAHYRRRDHWYRWVEWFSLTALWWHPLVWLARLGVRKAEEDCCDAWVLWTLPHSAKDYAGALLKTLDYLSQKSSPMPTAACGFAERRSFKNVKTRFTTILKHKPSHAMNRIQKAFTIALAVLALPLSGYLLQTQVTAQEGEGPTEAEIVERKKEQVSQSEIQAMQESVEQRLVRLEKMVQQLVEHQEVQREKENRPVKDSVPAKDILMRQQARMEEQKLHMEHSFQQLQLARRQAEIERARMEAELARRQTQLDHAKQQYDSGIINEQDLLHLQHEAKMSELEVEQQKVKHEAHQRNLEMQLKHQELQLKQLERDQDQNL